METPTQGPTLYQKLGELAPQRTPHSATTLGNATADCVDSLALDALADERGQTTWTATTKETTDNDQEASTWLELLASS